MKSLTTSSQLKKFILEVAAMREELVRHDTEMPAHHSHHVFR